LLIFSLIGKPNTGGKRNLDPVDENELKEDEVFNVPNKRHKTSYKQSEDHGVDHVVDEQLFVERATMVDLVEEGSTNGPMGDKAPVDVMGQELVEVVDGVSVEVPLTLEVSKTSRGKRAHHRRIAGAKAE
jgi:hypothetical protein